MKIILFIFVVLTLQVQAQGLTFKLNGKVIHTVTKKNLREDGLKFHSNQVKKLEMNLFNAWRGYRKEYVGFNFVQVLEMIYGSQWKNSKKIIFKAIDGYSPSINTKKMLEVIKIKKNIGILSYKESEIEGFTSFKRGKKMINPGPFYLVWSHFTQDDKAKYGDILKWPYQLKEINVVLK